MSSNQDFKRNPSKFVHKRTKSKENKCQTGMKIKMQRIVLKQGMINVIRENGQRLLRPLTNWEGPPPLPECEVFIGKLPRDVFEDEIYPVFSKIGEVYEIRVMTYFSGLNRGFGFVMYSNVEYADRAIDKLNDYEIRSNKRIAVLRSVNNCRLRIDKLPQNLNVADFIEKIFNFTDHVEKVAVYRYPNGRIMRTLISYLTHLAAAKARRKLMMVSNIIFQGMKLTVDWAYPNEY